MKNYFIFLFITCLFYACTSDKKNNLANETSLYLLKHVNNPVNWYPWGPEALAKAKKENKLILISIGFSSCNWCHIMEKESFTDEKIAKYMNENFINIKVDKEERPDINNLYIKAVELVSRKSGWPLNCIALPDGKPFWGGTYFSKKEWLKNLESIVELYSKDNNKVKEYATLVFNNIQPQKALINNTSDNKTHLDLNLKKVLKKWISRIDTVNGGEIDLPKFPKPNNLSVMLRYAVKMNDKNMLNHVIKSLKLLARGGIYDHIEGGFSRYSSDKKWHIPHFEKMLYDNAQLIKLYSEAYQITKNKIFKNVVYKTLKFVENRMYDKSGGFYSSISAYSKDSNGKIKEGEYYIWDKSYLDSLELPRYSLFKNYYSINDYGLWKEEKYVLIKKYADTLFAKKFNIKIDSLISINNKWIEILLNKRRGFFYPEIDKKIITSWNALMLNSYLYAYKVFREPNFFKIALKNEEFISNNLIDKDGKEVIHTYNNYSHKNGFLTDYANIISAWINLYEATFNEQWLIKAKKLTEYVIKEFSNSKSPLFYYSKVNNNFLINDFDVIDKDLPSSNSLMANNLKLLSKFTNNKSYNKRSIEMLNLMKKNIEENPSFYHDWLKLYLSNYNPFYEVSIVGKKAFDFANQINTYFLPNKVIAADTTYNGKSNIFILKNKYSQENETLIYVCINNTCKKPTKIIKEAVAQIKR